MKNNIKYLTVLLLIILVFSACNNAKTAEHQEETHGHEQEDKHATPEGIVWLTLQQQKAIGLELGRVQERNLSTAIKITGRLELPPQYKAVVSTFMGGNVKEVKVIEGDQVRKGEVLATLQHPDYIELQQAFLQLVSSMTYLKEEYQRKKTLYEKQVSSAKAYQKAAADYHSAKAHYKGMKKKLELLGLDSEAIEEGKISASIAIKSPINGYVKAINISTGQYAAPQANMFEITNNAHVHADFMVYEKDADKVKEGQIIRFTVANMPDKILQAKVFSVGKTIEEDPRAIHVHADIITPVTELIPGMYINGRLQVDDTKVKALPQGAIVKDGNKRYIFVKESNKKTSDKHEDSSGTAFQMVEITTGITDQGFVEIHLLHPLPDSTLVVTKGAYYLQADMSKEENEHSH